jgi:hypothetical protein
MSAVTFAGQEIVKLSGEENAALLCRVPLFGIPTDVIAASPSAAWGS